VHVCVGVCDCTEWFLVQCRLVPSIHRPCSHCITVSGQSVPSHQRRHGQQEFRPGVSHACFLTYLLIYFLYMLTYSIMSAVPAIVFILPFWFVLLVLILFVFSLLDGLGCCLKKDVWVVFWDEAKLVILSCWKAQINILFTTLKKQQSCWLEC